MSQIRVAVDQKAKDILEEYFAEHDYGKQLVRDIPRRVTAALSKRLDAPIRSAALDIRAAVPTADGHVLIEGVFSARTAADDGGPGWGALALPAIMGLTGVGMSQMHYNDRMAPMEQRDERYQDNVMRLAIDRAQTAAPQMRESDRREVEHEIKILHTLTAQYGPGSQLRPLFLNAFQERNAHGALMVGAESVREFVDKNFEAGSREHDAVEAGYLAAETVKSLERYIARSGLGKSGRRVAAKADLTRIFTATFDGGGHLVSFRQRG